MVILKTFSKLLFFLLFSLLTFIILPDFFITHAALRDGLVGHYTFDDTGNPWKDYSGKNNNIVPSADPAYVYNLYGRGSYSIGSQGASLPNSADFVSQNVTVGFWAYGNLTSYAWFSYPMTVAGDCGWANRHSCVESDEDGNCGESNNRLASGWFCDNPLLHPDQPSNRHDDIEVVSIGWHHYTYVHDASTNRRYAYVDCRKEADTPGNSNTLNLSGTAFTGYRSLVDNDPPFTYYPYYQWSMDDIAVWNRALSELEVASICTAGIPPPQPPQSFTLNAPATSCVSREASNALSWNAAVDATYYNVWRFQTFTGWQNISGNHYSTSFTDPANNILGAPNYPQQGTGYLYKITAVNDHGTTDSNTVASNPITCDTTPPTVYFNNNNLNSCYTPSDLPLFSATATDTSGIDNVVFRLTKILPGAASSQEHLDNNAPYEYSGLATDINSLGGTSQKYKIEVKALDVPGNETTYPTGASANTSECPINASSTCVSFVYQASSCQPFTESGKIFTNQ